jgi:prevent-host-death family protein
VTELTATEVARHFSEVLNRVAEGEEIEVVRNGATVAVLAPPKRGLLSPARFRELIDSAPHVDDDFAADVRSVREDAGPPENPWPS